MPNLRIGIDVGGTFTHGVILRPPGEVVATARVPTTHAAASGVAEGVRQALAQLLSHADAQDIELVAHSTTQATNALLEGDVAPVILAVIVPPGEGFAVKNALPQGSLNIGGGHSVGIERVLIPWEDAAGFKPPDKSVAPASVPEEQPVAVVQPLAGQHEDREELVAAKYRALGHPVVCASDITQVLGLAARARTAVVNASMLPKMLATARFTAQAVGELLPGVPVQVVRSDGGAMSLAEMQRLPVLSLLSGPAAGASAALARSGLSNVVFIEVGGTSTDITLIKDGRVRHRYATVGGQRLLVPALDLRTVAVGGGSMLRADAALFGPRSAHIAGLPYLFQALQDKTVRAKHDVWTASDGMTKYQVALYGDNRFAVTLTDAHLEWSHDEMRSKAQALIGSEFREDFRIDLDYVIANLSETGPSTLDALHNTMKLIVSSIRDLASEHAVDLKSFTLVGGGGGAPCVLPWVAEQFGLPGVLIPDHAVISAIGAALAVSCVSLSKSVAEPSAGDIAELTAEVEWRLSAQGAERVSTDYEFDAQRQVLTVTGRGSKPYAQDAKVRDPQELQEIANRLVSGEANQLWQADQLSLWSGSRDGGGESATHEKRTAGAFLKGLFSKPEPGMQAVLLNHYGQCLWQGVLREFWAAAGNERETVLKQILELRTQYTDGGPVLPGLALACAGRLIPLDQLASAELIAEVLRWEQLPPDAAGCFLLRG